MQRKRSKLLAYMMIFTMTLALGGCGGKAPSTQESTTPTSAPTAAPAPAKSLYEHGMDVIALMDEMLDSELYLTTMSGSADIQAKAAELAQGNYDAPQAVYQITVPTFSQLLALLEEEMTGINALSEELQAQLNAKSASAFITQLNAMEGTIAIATGSIFTANKLFVSSELTENTVYLYTFETGNPIAIVFVQGEDNAVSANGYFLMNQSISAESAEALQEALQGAYLDCTVKEVTTD